MRVLVTGGGGALGGHLVKRLQDQGHQVRAVDIKPTAHWWQLHEGVVNVVSDLSRREEAEHAMRGQEWVFNLSANMGGIGYIESHRADCMLSVLINTNLLQAAKNAGVERYFQASSACVYAADKQDSSDAGYRLLKEEDAYPAMPEAGYGEEKLFGERMCQYFHEDYGLDVRVVRLHNVYATHCEWRGGREKAPAAICRKVAEAKLSGSGEIEIWGDGSRTRSFLWVDDFVEGAMRIMLSDYSGPLNLGSEEVVTIDELVTAVEDVAGVHLRRRFDLEAAQGVMGRGSDNTLLRHVTGWEPETTLAEGLAHLYGWIEAQVATSRAGGRP